MLEPIEFTSAMRKAPTAVSIVTTSGEHGVHGATVSAVCSLSAAPPAVLICLNKSSRILGLIEEHGTYCINFATKNHKNLALAFAGVSGLTKYRNFNSDDWSLDPSTGLPILKRAAAVFTCLHVQTISYGTHRILIGKVESAASADEIALTYWDGDFRSLVDLPENQG